MPSTPKRPSLGRLLASLRPSRGGASPSHFPVQTGFPTSLADLVVRNHGRFRKNRKPRRPNPAVLPPPSPTVTLPLEVDNEQNPPTPPPAEPLSPVVAQRLDSAPRQDCGATVIRLRPELLAVGGAVALALLAVWSEGTVAAFTVAALALLWIESASRRHQRLSRPAEAEALLDSCGRGPGPVSPIREAEEARRSSCSDSDKGSEAPTPRTAERRQFLAAAGEDEDPTTPKRKAKRSLRKLISKKLQRKPSSKDSSWPPDGEAEQASAGGGDADPVQIKTESLVSGSESSLEWSSSSSEQLAVAVDRRGPAVKFPLLAFVPVILVGLAAGKLPATALAVLCVAFSSAVQRLS